ncbi:uncharacterized protein LOC119459142 [Dermacentor silvarum]|uniref:uncharacterized protein LOC119459142 n=1 Tax=Dermacentor silvarum TaxID=543639 RepID=UPI0021013DC8|nr:uncharacterized protein LOC119459142 [Dermacentor silvarum]
MAAASAVKYSSVSCNYSEWHFDVILFEDGEHQHPATTVRAKEAYFAELFNSVSRRLSLLQVGRFVFIRHGFETLSQAQSKSLFRTTRRVPTVHEVHANWKSSLASSFATRTRDKDAIIILTRRTLNHLNGDDANGFSVKGGICTADNISLVKDDGVFGAVNLLVKIFLHAAGVDFDGFGAAIGCPANQGYLMGGKKLHLPLQFSRCSMSLVHAALRQLKCIKSRMGSKVGHAIPMPPKMSRDAYCSALGSRSCDDRGMDKLEHKRPEKYECFVYCCKGFYNMFEKVAPDGLKCGDDCFNYKDKRCINGQCKRIS